MMTVALSGCATASKPKPVRADAEQVRVRLQSIWRTNLGYGTRIRPRQQSPAADDEHLFVCDAKRVLALDLETGRRAWTRRLDATLTGCVAQFADQLYVIDIEGQAYGLGKEDGAVRWRAHLGAESFVAPVANADVLIIQTANEQLHALNPHDGQELWTYSAYSPRLALFGGFQPILVGPYVIAGFADGALAILDWRRGQAISFRQLAVPVGTTDIDRLVDIDTALFSDDNVLYVAAYGGSLLALQLRTGRELWRHNFGGSRPLAADDDTIYGIGAENNIYAFAKRDGQLKWQNDAYAALTLTGLATMAGQLVLADEDGHLSVLSPQGQTLARRRIAFNPIYRLIQLAPTGVLALDTEGFISLWSVAASAD